MATGAGGMSNTNSKGSQKMPFGGALAERGRGSNGIVWRGYSPCKKEGRATPRKDGQWNRWLPRDDGVYLFYLFLILLVFDFTCF